MKTDVAIVGGGPGGTALSMFLAKEGIRSTIIEKEVFPRYHIGESMTGECGGVMRALGLEEKMAAYRYPVKWGVKVFGPKGNPWFVRVAKRNEKNEIEPTFTWQVRRSTFDKMMLDESISRGVEFVHGQALKPLRRDDGSVYGVRVRMADGGEQDIESEVLVDVSGQHTWGYHAGLTSAKVPGNYDRQVAIFSQVANPLRDEGKHGGDTLILYKRKVHWGWFIPIDDTHVSIAVISPVSYFQSKKESKADFLRRELHELHPEFKRRIPEIEFAEEVRAIPNYSYHVRQFSGKGFLCLGDAHRFIDPIFSFGMYVTTKEAQFAAKAIQGYLNGAHRDDPNPFAEHQALCEFGLNKYQDLIDGFWCEPFAFAYLAHAKHPDFMVDLFAGRIYGTAPNPALDGIRGIIQHTRNNPAAADWEDKEAIAG